MVSASWTYVSGSSRLRQMIVTLLRSPLAFFVYWVGKCVEGRKWAVRRCQVACLASGRWHVPTKIPVSTETARKSYFLQLQPSPVSLHERLSYPFPQIWPWFKSIILWQAWNVLPVVYVSCHCNTMLCNRYIFPFRYVVALRKDNALRNDNLEAMQYMPQHQVLLKHFRPSIHQCHHTPHQSVLNKNIFFCFSFLCEEKQRVSSGWTLFLPVNQ